MGMWPDDPLVPGNTRNFTPPRGTPDTLTVGPPGMPQIPVGDVNFDKPSVTMTMPAPTEKNIVQRESGGKPFIGYTPSGKPPVDLSTAPLDEFGFPVWEGNIDPSTGLRSHAAGLYQFQPKTWREGAEALGIHDFSPESQKKVYDYIHGKYGDTPWAASEPKYAAGNYKVSPSAISSEQQRPDTSVVYMPPQDYLDLVPLLDDGAKRKRALLDKSLNAGDEVESIPTLDVKQDKGNLRVTDQDGRNRAQAAIDAGVDLIPVAVRGAPTEFTNDAGQKAPAKYEKIVGMGGKELPFDFNRVWPEDPLSKTPVTQATPWWLKAADYLNPVAGVARGVAGELTGEVPQTLPSALGATVAQVGHGLVEPVVAGAIEGGQRALGVGEQGQDPTRPLGPNTLAAAQTLGVIPNVAGFGPATVEAGGRFSPLAIEAPANALMRPPSNITPERAALAQTAIRDFNIPVTAADIGGNPTVRAMTSASERFPLSGAAPAQIAKQQAFNRAVSKSFGEDSPVITQEVMNQAKRRIGGVINRVENSNEVRLDEQFMGAMFGNRETGEPGILTAAGNSLTTEEASVVQRLLRDTFKNMDENGVIKGETYGNLMRKGAPLERATANNNSNIRYYASQIKENLQDALQRSLSDEELAAYKNARFEYKNMKTIEPLVNKSPEGNISPALLNARVTAKFPDRAYDVSGTNSLDTLGKIGQAFLKEPGTSFTSERALMNRLLETGALGGAGGLAATVAGIIPAAAGLASTIGLNRLLGNALRSPALANRVIERALFPQGGNALLGEAAQNLPAMRNYLIRGKIRQMQAPPSP